MFYGHLILSASLVSASQPGVTYTAIFEGVSDKGLLSEINAVCDSVKLKDRPPASINLLHARAAGDIQNIKQLLRTKGYFKSTIDIDIDSEKEPVLVTFRIFKGPRFVLGVIDFMFTERDLPSGLRPSDPGEIGLLSGKPFTAGSVLNGQEELLLFFRRRGFPFVKIENRQVVADHKDETVDVTFWIDTGPESLFGKTVITGLVSVDESFVLDMIPWKEGDRYDANLFTEVREILTDLGLFATVRIIEGESLDENSGLPIIIEVTERKHRSFGAGVKYMTDEGPGVKLLWEHRNMFHRGERFGAYTELSDFTMSAEGRFRKPDFIIEDQSLRLSLRLAEDQPDAYTSKSFISSAFIDRNLTKDLNIGVGFVFKSSKIEQLETRDSFNMISLPLYCDWDTSDDLLDPGSGGRLDLQITPFYEPSGSPLLFTKGLVSYTRYIKISQKPPSVFAGSLKLGTINGASRDEIPADERFYAGGGGSIRGYAFQSVAPFSGGVPIGGKSLLELSMEIRLKISDRFGLVGFMDGGSAFTESISSSGEDLLWGAGLGLRYFTPIGPLRFDIGIPLNGREGIDDSFQIYISLGQAF
jgi:translocation and assembly module TamA